jgi:hypothetical protein
MTMEQYNRATAILEEKKQLEETLYEISRSIDFIISEEYIEVSNKLFILGQEFSTL